MKLLSWGNYPKIENKVLCFEQEKELQDIINRYDELIPYGNGKSYGDSALSQNIIRVKPYNYFLHFDESTGLLHVQAGVLLSAILDVFIPRGWFLKITPGTKLITVGGAIASDVHGKNHHKEGCFSECVKMFRLMLADGSIVECNRRENTELFRATCGGMGLTGVILDAGIFLKKISSSQIIQKIVKTANLKESFEAFEEHKDANYSVGWIDSLAKGYDMGKGLITTGDFSDDEEINYKSGKKINIPFYFPHGILNTTAVQAFNFIYYERVRKKINEQLIDIDSFFYPLDTVNNWNKIYGKKGFTQYQFILPKKASFEGINKILKIIATSGRGSFLAVLKLYGQANNNYMSFPMEGYSLALDFKIEKGLFEFLDILDDIVLEYGGRIYLAKDVRMKREIIEKAYPNIGKFRMLREKYKMYEKFSSLQSRRLGI
jgi:decaprenylphospho-beta-D-ribofuranose 2-oxidase